VFTGLVETTGKVIEVTARRGSKRFGIASDLPVGRMQDGESVAVDGVCLTVVARRGDRFHADVIAETLALTTLGEVRPGKRVNLERSLALGDRLGGHLVQGHVDCTAGVSGVERRGDDYRLRVAWTPEIRRFVAHKGSVAIHGVSLTVAALSEAGFELALIPETLQRTNLGDLRAGDRVNVEVDLLARYLDRLLHADSEPAE